MNKSFLFALFCLSTLFLQAQDSLQSSGPQMADVFREEGKIYVVISVIAIVFVSIVFFLVYLERKISRVERELNHKN